MKHLILVCLTFIRCDNSYEIAEDKAIQDFANDYLQKNHLNDILNPILLMGEKSPRVINLDSLDLKVYISDALIPISQIKKDNEWMFNDNYFGTKDSAIFYQIVKSSQFAELEYRVFDKAQLKLVKPYRQFEKSKEKIPADEKYIILYFSRICFDKNKENGVVVIDYRTAHEGSSAYGYNMALLIKKIGDKWTYVSRK